MFVNRIKIWPDLLKLQLWFSRLRQCLFLKSLRQWTHKMGRFLSTLKQDVFALLVPSLLTACWQLVTSSSNNLLSSCNSTTLSTSSEWQPWWNNSIVITRWQACHKPVANTSCWQVVRFLRVCLTADISFTVC
jgi:hypothetical protein